MSGKYQREDENADSDTESSDDDGSASARKIEAVAEAHSVRNKSAREIDATARRSPYGREFADSLGAATKKQRTIPMDQVDQHRSRKIWIAQREVPTSSQRSPESDAFRCQIQNTTGFHPEPARLSSFSDSRYQQVEMIRRQEEWVAALRQEVALRLAARGGLSDQMALERQCREAELQELLRRRYPGQLDSLSRMQPPGGSVPGLGFPAAMSHSGTGPLMSHDNSSLSQHSSGRSTKSESTGVAAAAVPSAPPTRLAPGEGMPLLLPNDKALLSDYQILIRESLEFFEVQASDMLSSVPGRKKNVEVGQVGIRCRYCAHRPAHWKGRGAVYFPGNLASVYQAAQNMASNHLLKACEELPADVNEKFAAARQKQKEETRRSGGKTYWTETSRHVGLEEREGRSGIWFKKSS